MPQDIAHEIEACRNAESAWREASGAGDPGLHDAALLELRAAELRLSARLRSLRSAEESPEDSPIDPVRAFVIHTVLRRWRERLLRP